MPPMLHKRQHQVNKEVSSNGIDALTAVAHNASMSELYIRQWRAHRGLNQERLGERIGKSKGQVSKYETGTSAPTLATLYQLAFALNCEPQDLFRPPPSTEMEELRAQVDKMNRDEAARMLRLWRAIDAESA